VSGWEIPILIGSAVEPVKGINEMIAQTMYTETLFHTGIEASQILTSENLTTSAPVGLL
jgi:hypothetical protein